MWDPDSFLGVTATSKMISGSWFSRFIVGGAVFSCRARTVKIA